jgi:hypothetical protein
MKYSIGNSKNNNLITELQVNNNETKDPEDMEISDSKDIYPIDDKELDINEIFSSLLYIKTIMSSTHISQEQMRSIKIAVFQTASILLEVTSNYFLSQSMHVTESVNDIDKSPFIGPDTWTSIRHKVTANAHNLIRSELLHQMLLILCNQSESSDINDTKSAQLTGGNTVTRLMEETIRLIRNCMLFGGHKQSGELNQKIVPSLMQWLGNIRIKYQRCIGQVLGLLCIFSPHGDTQEVLSFASNTWRILQHKLQPLLTNLGIKADNNTSFVKLMKQNRIFHGALLSMGGMLSSLVCDPNSHDEQIKKYKYQIIKQFLDYVELILSPVIAVNSAEQEELSDLQSIAIKIIGDLGSRQLFSTCQNSVYIRILGSEHYYQLCIQTPFATEFGYPLNDYWNVDSICYTLMSKIPSISGQKWSDKECDVACSAVESLSKLCVAGLSRGK